MNDSMPDVVSCPAIRKVIILSIILDSESRSPVKLHQCCSVISVLEIVDGKVQISLSGAK